jgi:hypothetical protein
MPPLAALEEEQGDRNDDHQHENHHEGDELRVHLGKKLALCACECT